MKWEVGKEYRTRDWHKARVYATDGGGSNPIHGAIMGDSGWLTAAWKPDGRWSHFATDARDLMPPRPPPGLGVYY
jgi:hypothetical protein